MIDVNRVWYQRHWLSILLWPLSLLYRCLIYFRRLFYRWAFFKTTKLPVPVIVVGNITVGGTGKTPLVIALVEYLKQQGWQPGVISRGYGGQYQVPCQEVLTTSDPVLTGDEPLLIARNTGVPVFVSAHRVIAAQELLAAYPHCDVILSDDGLQHLALARDIEIIVVDGIRRFGNQHCLPAGPLREPLSRINSVDFIVTNGKARDGEYAMKFEVAHCLSVSNPARCVAINKLQGKKVIAVAGIGNPDRFFQTLRELGLVFESRIFPDHHAFCAHDIACAEGEIVLMTEKDAIKCREFSDDAHYYLAGQAELSEGFFAGVVQQLDAEYGEV